MIHQISNQIDTSDKFTLIVKAIDNICHYYFNINCTIITLDVYALKPLKQCKSEPLNCLSKYYY